MKADHVDVFILKAARDPKTCGHPCARWTLKCLLVETWILNIVRLLSYFSGKNLTAVVDYQDLSTGKGFAVIHHTLRSRRERLFVV